MLKLLDRLRSWRRVSTPAGVPWAIVVNRGVILGLGPGVAIEEVSLIVSDDDGKVLDSGHPTAAVTIDDAPAGYRAFPAALFASPRRFQLTIALRGDARRRAVVTGPDRYAVSLDGVVGHALEGWASPLFDSREVVIELLVDGFSSGRCAPDVMRRDLMFVSAQGGWNGFRLPLPPHALDGSPHDLAVRVGGEVHRFGSFRSRPRYSIDTVGETRLTGWYFNEGDLDRPLTVRLLECEREIARTRTHGRADLAELFGRRFAAFAFTDVSVRDGQILEIGEPGAARILGHVAASTLRDRVNLLRASARRLLTSGAPASTREARGGIAATIASTERLDFRSTLAIVPDRTGHASSAEPSWPAIVSEPPPACAIVPVYKGLDDVRLCLESLIPELGARLRAVVIDDASPDPAVSKYLAALAAERHPRLTILRNEDNLGFIGTVNRGFALLEAGEDAILLNADTILPPGGLARLARHCHSRPGIASVTPMSNNATILSFPDPAGQNPPAFGLDTATLDLAFREIASAPVEIPTGIGFCMYVNGAALAEAGPFSPEWGRGYCEEVDWSLAARDLGWIHLAALDVFVMHEGSVSFGVAERSAILEINHGRLEAKYPEYLDEVGGFVRDDPLASLRFAVAARLLAARCRRLTLHVTHGMGGGTKRYIDDLRALPRGPDHEIGILTPAYGERGSLRLRCSFGDDATVLDIGAKHLASALDTFEKAGLTLDLHISSRLVYSADVMATLTCGRWRYTVTLHDFQWYCPKVHLTDERRFYCGEPPVEVCQICVRHERSHDFGDQNPLIDADVRSWIEFNTRILRGAERIIAPSRDTADRYARRLGLNGIEVLPHVEKTPVSPPSSTLLTRSGALRVAVVGAIAHHKGFDLLVEMAEIASRERMPIIFRVIGYTVNGERLTQLSNIEVTGPYQDDELKPHLDAFDPDFVFLSSVWPETYSYVLSEVWGAGYPVVAFDFGAPAERIRQAGGGATIAPSRNAREVLTDLLGLSEFRRPGGPTAIPTALPTDCSL